VSPRATLLSGAATLGVLLAAGALVLAILAFNKDAGYDARIKTLQAQVKTLGESETQSRVNEANLNYTGLQEKMSKMARYVSALVECVPELQSEIGGLGINYHVSALPSEDSFSISNSRQPSRSCETTLYGTGEHAPLGG